MFNFLFLLNLTIVIVSNYSRNTLNNLQMGKSASKSEQEIMAIRGGLKCLQQEHRFENVFALLVAPNRAKLTLMVARKPMIFCFVLFCVTLVPTEQ